MATNITFNNKRSDTFGDSDDDLFVAFNVKQVMLSNDLK